MNKMEQIQIYATESHPSISEKYLVEARIRKENDPEYDKGMSMVGNNIKDLLKKLTYNITCVLCVDDNTDIEALNKCFNER